MGLGGLTRCGRQHDRCYLEGNESRTRRWLLFSRSRPESGTHGGYVSGGAGPWGPCGGEEQPAVAQTGEYVAEAAQQRRTRGNSSWVDWRQTREARRSHSRYCIYPGSGHCSRGYRQLRWDGGFCAKTFASNFCTRWSSYPDCSQKQCFLVYPIRPCKKWYITDAPLPPKIFNHPLCSLYAEVLNAMVLF